MGLRGLYGWGHQQARDLEYAKYTPIEQFVSGFVGMADAKDVDASENSGGWAMYVRRLYLDLEPIKGVEAQYGSFDINRGAASEITTYDNDGWISGERLMLKRPHNFFFDEASVTYAYFGDIYTPNFFERGNRLKQSNYHQFLLRKKAFNRVDASFDYTWQVKANTFREAFVLKMPETRVLDSVRVESYQRINAGPWGGFSFGTLDPGKGYAITGDKKLGKRGLLEGGYANIDIYSVILTQTPMAGLQSLGINGDSYGVGKRFFVRPAFKLTPYLEASGFYTHAYDFQSNGSQVLWNKQALNAGLVLDIKKALFPGAAVR